MVVGDFENDNCFGLDAVVVVAVPCRVMDVPVPVAPGTIQSISRQYSVRSIQIVESRASPNPRSLRHCHHHGRRIVVMVVVAKDDRGVVPTHSPF